MLLWIAGHTNTEISIMLSVRLSVDKLTIVHLHDKFHEFISMFIALVMRTKTRIAVHSIATQGKNVLNTEEVKVYE